MQVTGPMTRRCFCWGMVGVMGIAVAMCCNAEEKMKTEPGQVKRPNVLLIVSEDNGPELGCYGDRFARTPVLDRLANQGVRFEWAYVPYSVCSPSRASFLTGLYPHQNGQIGLATHKYAMYQHFPSIPSYLKKVGYKTGLIGKLHVNPEKAFPFDFWKIRSANFGKGQRDMRKYARAAAEFFELAGEKPFFLSINYPDAHFPLHRQDHGLPKEPMTGKDVKPLPWMGADSPRLREFTADYYNCLARLDAGVEMLLEELKKAGKADNTIIIYIGDHGAQFSRGKCGVHEAALRVPMIAYWPEHMKPGTVRKELVSTIDILPTFLEAAGVEVPAHLPGHSLLPMMRGEPAKGHDVIFGVTTGAAPVIHEIQFSIRDDRYRLVFSPFHGRTNRFAKTYLDQSLSHFMAGTKQSEIDASTEQIQAVYREYLRPPKYELYDLKEDPYEFKNLLGAEQPGQDVLKVRDMMLAKLEKFQTKHVDPMSDPALLKEYDDEMMRIEGFRYNKDKTHRWGYLDSFPAWMRNQESGGE